MQFNGPTQATAYGDDLQNATNYPLVRIVNTNRGHVFYCKMHNPSSMGVATGSALVSTQFDVPPTSNWDPASCTWWRTAFHRRHKGSASTRTREHGHHQGKFKLLGDPLFRGRPTIIPSNVGPPAVIALWSLASPILPPQHAPRNESPRQYSPSISSRSRSPPNGCAREARESPCLRWS